MGMRKTNLILALLCGEIAFVSLALGFSLVPFGFLNGVALLHSALWAFMMIQLVEEADTYD